MMRPAAYMILGLALAVPSAAWADDDDGRAAVETPAEALKRSTPSDGAKRANPSQMMVLQGGILTVERPDSDLIEALPVGSQEDFERSGYEVIRAEKVEIIIDREGQIYRDRNYHGIIPGIRDAFNQRRFDKMARRSLVGWVGFQPMAAVSRIFWQLSDPEATFEVNRIDDTTLEVFFPKARFCNRNSARAIDTQFFGGAVASMDGRRERGGVRFIIRLKKAANYLYRFEPPFLYLDLERTE